jgi:hypothetical protein
MEDTIIFLVGVGEKSGNNIKEYYNELKNSYFNVKVLTNQPTYFESEDVITYKKEIFNYFDKIHESLDLIQLYNKNILFLDDDNRLSKDTLLEYIEKSSKHNFTYVKNYPKGNFLNYKDEYCFRFLLEYMDYRNIEIKDYETICERLMYFNKTLPLSEIKSNLETIQPIFDYISLMNDTTYTKPFVLGGAEGLALSIVFNLSDISFNKIDLYG